MEATTIQGVVNTIVLESENGTKFELRVDNDGILTTKEVSENE